MMIPYAPLAAVIVLLAIAGLMPRALLETVRTGRHYLFMLLATAIYETVAISLAIRAVFSALA